MTMTNNDQRCDSNISASYDSVMAMYREVVEALMYDTDAVDDAETRFIAEVQRLSAQFALCKAGKNAKALTPECNLNKQQTGRLILEASTGMHGEIPAILAKEWVLLSERLEEQTAPKGQP